MRFLAFAFLGVLVPCLIVGCGDDDEEEKPACEVGSNSGCGDGMECQATADGKYGCFCSVDRNTGCTEEGLVCESVEGGNSGCYPPVTVAGKVFDLADDSAIEGARVVARDANNAALSSVAITDESGNYALRVPAKRTKDGALASDAVTMRADASGYLTFPRAPRVALPVARDQATGDPLSVQTAATDLGMLRLASSDGLGTITGTVVSDAARGTLVVAGGDPDSGGGVSGVADTDGSYAVFNVPAGSIDVHGYKVGLQLDGNTASVSAGETTSGIDLQTLGEATAVISGKVEIVNPGAGSDTSVIMVVQETFDRHTNTGETPPGLRAFPVSGEFSIAGVPSGNYAMLAAFENDFLVRDPDTAIGGTDIVYVTVGNDSQTLDQGFKVTGSLDVVSPDKEEEVSGTPSFVWVDDAGEDAYTLEVFDAYGNLLWTHDMPGVSGDRNVTVEYGGDALTAGMIYQFRATSFKQGGAPIARTEDLRGTFLYR
jgi:hypothetical protein